MRINRARNKFIKYLKERNIKFSEHIQENGYSYIYMLLTRKDNCPDKVLECSIFFYESGMETRVYYNANASTWIRDNKDDLSNMYRLLNYINAMVWPFTQDGLGGVLYETRHLQTPRFYITEDGNYDLTATTLIDYDHFEMAPLETEDYCTAAIPELMNKLSIPMFLLLNKRISVDESIAIIEREVLNRK